ncbi:MAG: hypothetical protein WA738_05835 [Candidatus Angelobacter sp.]
MADLKRIRSRTRKKAAPFTRVLRFPQAKGKIIAEVALSVSPADFAVDIRFQDKTSLTFDLEPCVSVFPELTDWKTGNYKPLKRWRPVHSRSSRI